ncbi:MAG: hypothetical protein KGL39_15070 [Patescibacteria group bacterium]|nr:hypothetical protein [Patescibacteria group bacterium]
MSNVAPEGVPHLIPDAPAPTYVPVPVPSGLSAAHVVGGSLGGLVGAVTAGVLAHFHYHVSDLDASLLGSAALSAGVAFGHVVSKVGVLGAFKQLAWGSKS